ncbi:hypothetical protein MNEG_9517 [Monoraphidium neglectum]|jgi:hypothetical protein|uniref:Uncharacterized protein n=1 Tax=Monoraphidium neglectum TaxID=145388 RepID=A0A0D2JG77_9CHLO|nr:hypothetical protein MNEG_9517 [Monoraphidium neglectum]KIY98447.1 hypothetical protein MNEG_9517 [Monoraphidium neglectum]|eukprot:XP_013897467.1 hypothetical protein MNEG_9517 [Monoraphidium neglectum]
MPSLCSALSECCTQQDSASLLSQRRSRSPPFHLVLPSFPLISAIPALNASDLQRLLERQVGTRQEFDSKHMYTEERLDRLEALFKEHDARLGHVCDAIIRISPDTQGVFGAGAAAATLPRTAVPESWEDEDKVVGDEFAALSTGLERVESLVQDVSRAASRASTRGQSLTGV